jgi:hypothetical protein
MHDFETDAGITPNPALAPTLLSTTAPTVQQLNDATSEDAMSEQAASPSELRVQQPINTPQQTAPGHRRQRSNKGVPSARLEPAHRVECEGDAANFLLVQSINSCC